MSWLFEQDDVEDKGKGEIAAILEDLDAEAHSIARPRAAVAADALEDSRPWRKSHREKWDRPLDAQTLQVGAHCVRFKERFGAGHNGEINKTGSRIWDAALVLSKFVEADLATSDGWRTRTVIELGAGLGVPSLSAAMLGAKRVVATDMSENIPLLNENIRLNFDAAERLRIEAQELSWDDALNSPLAEVQWDVILCSDLLFSLESISMLIGAIRALSKEGTVVYSCMEHRFDGCSEFYSGMRAAGFDVHRIPQNEMHPVYRGEAFHLYRHQVSLSHTEE